MRNAECKGGLLPLVIPVLVLLLFCGCSQVSGKLLILEGNFLKARGMYTEAISSYMQALAYEEAAPYSEFGLGSVYFAIGEEKAARERFAEAARKIESFSAATNRELRYRIFYNTGVVLFSEGDFSGAADSFREALKIDGGRIEAKRNLELSIRSLARENTSSGNDTSGETESMAALFQYVREKEYNHWQSREWQQEEEIDEPDY